MKNCLVIRKYGYIGDLLMMTPALKELSKTYKIDLLIPEGYEGVFQNLDFIKDICFNKDTINYDKIFDLNDYEFNYEQIYQTKIEKTKQELFAEALNVKITDLKPLIILDKRELAWINNYLKDINRKILLLAPKSTDVSRDWSLNNWEDLIKKIKKMNYQIIIADKNLQWNDNDIIFFNNHSLRELFSLVFKSNFVISHDSGLLHIAGAFDKYCLGIFGPTDPRYRAIYKNSYYVKEDIICSPCWYNRCENLTCMKNLKLDKVENKLLEMMQNGN